MYFAQQQSLNKTVEKRSRLDLKLFAQSSLSVHKILMILQVVFRSKPFLSPYFHTAAFCEHAEILLLVEKNITAERLFIV